MFCGKCGKKVREDMLFCPFCGNAIVIPDQDEDEEQNGSVDERPETKAPEMRRSGRKTISLFAQEEYEGSRMERSEDAETADTDGPDESFEDTVQPGPEDVEGAYDEYDADQTDEFEKHGGPDRQSDDPGSSTRNIGGRRRTDTYIPVRNTRSEDMFLGTEEDDYDDDYDDYDDDERDYDDYGDYDDDPKPKKSFFKRHLFGIIIWCVILAILIGGGIFVCLEPGQELLARVNLAWDAQAYAAVGFNEYRNGNFAEAANYYVRAFDKDSENYEYAHSAMVSYYDANDIDNAAKMAEKCIDMRPDEADAYRELLTIYGNEELPSMVKDYIQQGYQKTGDEYLNPNNWSTLS